MHFSKWKLKWKLLLPIYLEAQVMRKSRKWV